MFFQTDLNISLLQTKGVAALELPDVTVEMLFKVAFERYKEDPNDYFTRVHAADGDSLDISDGNGNLVTTESVFEYPGITEDVWVIVDDYGPNSTEGLVITILLPEEY